MAFLFSSTIVLYAVLAPVLGRVFDRVLVEDGGIQRALVYLGGVQFSVIFVVVLVNTFVPRGAVRFNPEMLYDEKLEDDGDDLVGERGKEGSEIGAEGKAPVAVVRSVQA